MKIFSCAACGQTLFFENSQCTKCGHALAFLPDRALLSAIEPANGPESAGLFVALAPVVGKGIRYRQCGNQIDHAACNWAVPEGDPQRYCRACRLNQLIPNLANPGARAAWEKLESAKRRLIYTLIGLGLPLESREQLPEGGLAFCFLQDELATEKVFTGHNDGLITINVAEADAPFREKTRLELGETYRTLLGHFRHEIGHYYWDRLIKRGDHQAGFRELFGDESADYAEAVQAHYQRGAPGDWPTRFVSSYASMHPWEDWAESWAHYLHMVDTLETARSFGLALPPKPEGGARRPESQTRRLDFDDFDDLMGAWVPLTVAMNSLNRSMGLPDLYPFVLSTPAVAKLRFVHEVIESA
jgi:hypothetical protein